MIDSNDAIDSRNIREAISANGGDAHDLRRGRVIDHEDEGHRFGMDAVGHGEGEASFRNDGAILEVSANHTHQGRARSIFPVGALERFSRVPGVIDTLVGHLDDRGAILAMQSAEVAGQVVERAGVVVDIGISSCIGVGRVFKSEGANISVGGRVYIAWSRFNFIVQCVVNIDHEGHISRI